MTGDGRHCRVGEIVGRHVDRLDGGDRGVTGAGDAFLQLGHVGRERRLVADPRGQPAEQARHFRARLDEAKDVVHQQEHVAPRLDRKSVV